MFLYNQTTCDNIFVSVVHSGNMCSAGTWTVRGTWLAVQWVIKTIIWHDVSLFKLGDIFIRWFGFLWVLFFFLSISYWCDCVNWSVELQLDIYFHAECLWVNNYLEKFEKKTIKMFLYFFISTNYFSNMHSIYY